MLENQTFYKNFVPSNNNNGSNSQGNRNRSAYLRRLPFIESIQSMALELKVCNKTMAALFESKRLELCSTLSKFTEQFQDFTDSDFSSKNQALNFNFNIASNKLNLFLKII